MSATEAKSAKKTGAVAEFVEIVKTVAYALGIALVLRVLLFQPFTIPSESMVPNLLKGDYIIVSKYSYGWSRFSIPMNPKLFSGRIFDRTPKRGDIIVFKLPRDTSMDYIKRLVGLPGDRIQVKGGALYINGQMLKRQQLSPGTEQTPFGFTRPVDRFLETNPEGRSYITDDYGPGQDLDDTGVYVVPEKHYFFMGDNRDNSLDSRVPPEQEGVGFVPEENLEGKAQIILLSWDNASLFKPWTWFTKARPSRFFHLLK